MIYSQEKKSLEASRQKDVSDTIPLWSRLFDLRDKIPLNRERGAVLLIAIMVSSVALTVGIGVYNRTYKELLFASFWKQTQVAFVAADGGLECSLYWDLHPTVAPVSCFGFQVLKTDGTAWDPSLNLSVNLSVTTPLCVTMEITKDPVTLRTTIRARGYNTCDTNSARRVERGLRIDY